MDAVASPWFSTCFSPRIRFCNDLWSRSSSNLAGPGQGSTALRGAGHRSAPRRKSDVVWGRRSPTSSFSSHCLTLKPGHYSYEPVPATLVALVFIRQSTGRISCAFYVKVFSDPEVDSLFALKISTFFYELLVSGSPSLQTVRGGFWTNFTHFLRESELRTCSRGFWNKFTRST